MIVISNAFVYSTCLLVVVSRYGLHKKPGFVYKSFSRTLYTSYNLRKVHKGQIIGTKFVLTFDPTPLCPDQKSQDNVVRFIQDFSHHLIL